MSPDPKLPKPRAPKNNARWSAMEGRLKQVERALTTHEAIDSARFARTLAILPNILFLDHDDGRQRRQSRPRWWGDLEVREAVVATHRQATVDAACALLSARYGDRAPTRSSLARFWLQLDAVFAAS
ncbi:hypothetical protein DBR17_17940 [Sphingomonas sp. HMWF008]|nr:hypothetical protein DBR17_17940 [Sphingomonas sp. HMWF008]